MKKKIVLVLLTPQKDIVTSILGTHFSVQILETILSEKIENIFHFSILMNFV